MKEFTVSGGNQPIRFKVDGDVFTAIAPDHLPAGYMAKYFELMAENKLFQAHLELMNELLEKDSVDLFNERISSKENPITLQLLADIVTWLLGDVYMGNSDTGEQPQS